MTLLKHIIAVTAGITAVLSARASSIQRDSLQIEVELNGSAATDGNIRPMWSYSHEWGRQTQYKQWEGSAYSRIAYTYSNGSWATVRAGVGLEASTDLSRMMLHEAFVSGRLWIIDYTLGREAFTPIDQHSGLGLGTYLMSDNARPVWKAGLGFFDYYSIPGISDWVQLKGGLYLGKMPDEDGEGYTSNILLHEKFLYLRLGHFAVKPYLGLIHSVMMGGTRANGEVIPVDFWASFFGKGSTKLKEAGYEGEYYNAAGGHQGMWDLGIDAEFDTFSGSIYYQRPFSDMTAINLFDFARCKDITIGADIRLKHFKPVTEVCFEYMTTLWQGGNGPADPTFVSTGPKRTGEVITLAYKEISPETIRDYFDAGTIREWEAEHGPLSEGGCHEFMVKYANKGWEFGNRTPYLYNAYYPQGWTVNGLSMGWCLPLTDETMRTVAPGYSFLYRFPDLRIRAVNLGISGMITPKLSYKFKFTYSGNFGSYCEQYYSGIDFDKKRPYYYFESRKDEWYSGIWLDYRLGNFTLRSNLSYDFGDIYRSFSARLGVKYVFGKRFIH